MTFILSHLHPDNVRGKQVIEVGARDVNGSVRPIMKRWGPKDYVGIDIEKGPCVDIVCDALSLEKRYGKNSFDIVICAEMLEHAQDWHGVIMQIKEIVRPGGYVILTTRSEGFHVHGYPDDYWRFSVADLEHIFSDFEEVIAERDWLAPGAFVYARKPKEYTKRNIYREMYSIKKHEARKK